MNTTQEVLSSALQKNLGKPLRAEQLKSSWLKILVQPFAINELLNNSPQIVFGRRGSGKTMYFKALEEMTSGNLLLHPYLLVYVPVNELLVSACEPSRDDPRQHAKDCFASLMDTVGNSLLRYFDTITSNPTLADSFQITKSKANDLQETLLHFQYTLSHGAPAPAVAAGKSRLIATSLQTHTENAALSVGVATAKTKLPHLPLPQLEAKATNRRAHADSTESQLEAEHLATVPTSDLRKWAIQAVQQFGAESLIVVIDEWPLLGDAQVDFAEYIRRTLCGSAKLCVKLAADRFQCRLSSVAPDGQRRGLELGADIFEAADLDMPFHGTAESLTLYAEMLVKRLAAFEPRMYNHFGVQLADDPMTIIKLLFHNEHVFAELCNASQGLARDFLESFRLCSKEIQCDARIRITSGQVHKILISDSHSVMRNVRASESGYAMLNGSIRNVIVRSQHPFFFTRKEAPRSSHVLETLLSLRAVHALPPGYLRPEVSDEFDGYEVDYSIYCEWRELLEWIKPGLRPLDDLRASLRSLTRDAVMEQQVDLSVDEAIEAERIKCQSCNQLFFATTPSYVLKSLCPHCFEPVPQLHSPSQ